MKTVHEVRFENLRNLAAAENLTNAALSRRLGVTPQYLWQVLAPSKKRNIGDKFARRVEEAFGKPTGWLDRDQSVFILLNADRPLSVHESATSDSQGAEYVEIPLLETKAASSRGTSGPANKRKQRQLFATSWITALGLKVDKAAEVVVEDSNMSPRIEAGDLIVMNSADTWIQSGRIYVVILGDETVIRRLFKTPQGGLRVVSDNPDKSRFPDWELTAQEANDVIVVGRAVAVSGEL